MSPAEAITNIAEIRQSIDGKTDPVTLSEALVKLATYNAYVGDYVSTTHKAATDRAYSIYLEVLGKGDSATKAEQISRGESTEERARYEKIKFTYKSTEAVINAIHKRITTIENQIKREGQHG
jgi:hypothetical protein